MNRLTDCLGIQEGITAFVGGGGKTTAIYTLAKELSTQGNSVIVTTTTKMYSPNETEVEQVLLEPSILEVKEILKSKRLIAIGGGTLENKMIGITESLMAQLKEEVDYLLVEADGAKHYPLKVPAAHEPVIPKCSEQVVIVVGMRALGGTIENVCFRQAEVEALLGVNRMHKLTIEDVVQIISSPLGLLKGSEGREVSLLLNQIDEVEDKELVSHLIRRLKESGMKQIIMASVQQRQWRKA